MPSIRHHYINRQVMNAYKYYNIKSFPINAIEIAHRTPRCICLSYQEFAKLQNAKVSDVETMGSSETGFTLYKPDTNRYLIFYNTAVCQGRQNWTVAHELGHIYLRHLVDKSLSNKSLEKFYETEADLFARTLLAPFPLFQTLKINSVDDLRNKCGLSHEAALNTYLQYNDWKCSHIKTAFDADIKNIYSRQF